MIDAKRKQEPRGNSEERQRWLQRAFVALTREFARLDYAVPDNVRMSVGFPVGGGKGARAIGQCWGPQSSQDGHAEIFVSPELGVTTDAKAHAESVNALQVLAHEMAHAIVGVDAGHKKPFKQCATAIGLEGKMTATVAGPVFEDWATGFIEKHGTFPMGKLVKWKRIGKQGTRLLKCECGECGYIARVTRKWLDDAGAPICPIDQVQLECE